MYYHISFNTWLNFTRKNQKRERHYLKQEKLRNKCIKEGRAFVPEEFEEEKEQMINVTIEVDEVVYYTSEENVDEELQIDEESSNVRMKSLEHAGSEMKRHQLL